MYHQRLILALTVVTLSTTAFYLEPGDQLHGYENNNNQLFEPQTKRARLCGKKIIRELYRLCNGCIRPPDGVQILRKRGWLIIISYLPCRSI